MLHFSNGGHLVQSMDELPNFQGATELFLDVETTSFNDEKEGFSPYTGARICGIAVTVDSCPDAYYLPIRHRDDSWNLPLEHVREWVQTVLSGAQFWINHNVKFDAHFCAADGLIFSGSMCDTIVLAKILDSDRFTYNLTDLTKDWTGQDIEKYEKELKKYLGKSKDYGVIPADVLGEYACQDVFANRSLWIKMQSMRYEGCDTPWNTEVKVTAALFDMERDGMAVDRDELTKESYVNMYKLVSLEEELHTAVGWPIRPHTNEDCFEYLCTQHGLPVLGFTDKKEPSFDKNTLAQYLEHPDVVHNEDLRSKIEKILAYRKTNTLVSMFIEPYLKYEVDGFMHPDFNQSVRTARMSCSRPNAQQLFETPKTYIHPTPGCGIFSWDYSQIEFRIIVHYLKNEAAIKAYNEDPTTDFHSWVSQVCKIARKPSKSVNFGIGFGAGENKIITMLTNLDEVVGDIFPKIDRAIEAGRIQESQRTAIYQAMAREKGREIYSAWHAQFPELRDVRKRAEQAIKTKGYVYNAYGRHRRLPTKAAYKAFNAVVQSSAAEVLKERFVAIAPRYNSQMREWGIRPFALVHDEFALYAPIEVGEDPKVRKYIADVLEDTQFKFRVPIKVSGGWARTNWADAGKDEAKFKVL